MLLVSRVLLLPPVASQVRFMRNRAMLLPIFGIGVTALSLCAIAKAEEHGCTLEIPAIVVLPDYNLAANWDRLLLRCKASMAPEPSLQSKLEAVPAVFSS
jgi:hypothetical protein